VVVRSHFCFYDCQNGSRKYTVESVFSDNPTCFTPVT
jgi:hypothetical protein